MFKYIVVVRNIRDDITKEDIIKHFPGPILNFEFYFETKYRYCALIEFPTPSLFCQALARNGKLNLGHYCKAKVEIWTDEYIFERIQKHRFNVQKKMKNNNILS
jgi:hypothetical protein